METYWWSAFALGHLSLVIEFHLSQGNMDHPDCFHSNYSVHLVWKGRVLGGEREAFKPPPTQPSFSPTKPGKGWWEGTRSLKYQKDLWRQGQSPEGLHPMTTTVSLLCHQGRGLQAPPLVKRADLHPLLPKQREGSVATFLGFTQQYPSHAFPMASKGACTRPLVPPTPKSLALMCHASRIQVQHEPLAWNTLVCSR